jgi:hypothetical protein
MTRSPVATGVMDLVCSPFVFWHFPSLSVTFPSSIFWPGNPFLFSFFREGFHMDDSFLSFEMSSFTSELLLSSIFPSFLCWLIYPFLSMLLVLPLFEHSRPGPSQSVSYMISVHPCMFPYRCITHNSLAKMLCACVCEQIS